MAYLVKKVKTKHCVFVTRTKCFCYNPDASKKKRGVRMASTGESRAARNKRNAFLKRKYEIYNNFDIGDWWITLTWKKEALPGSADEAHKALTAVLSKIRRKLAKSGIPFVYYIKTEASETIRPHHHLIIRNNFDVLNMLFDEWSRFGRIFDAQKIYSFSDGRLVNYFLMSEHKGLEYEKFSHSRNLAEPKVEKRIYSFNSFRERPKAPPGFRVTHLYNGYADIDHHTYQEYELVPDDGDSGGGIYDETE